MLAALRHDLATALAEKDAAFRNLARVRPSARERLSRPLRAFLRWRRFASGQRQLADAPEDPARAAVLFVSGAVDVSLRYRCTYQAEQIRLLGGTATVVRHGDAGLLEAVDRHELVVLHRVAWGADVEALLERARRSGKRVIFDTDDLVFDPDGTKYVAALEDLPPEEVRLYEEAVPRYRRTLEHCDAVTTSTQPLAERARTLSEKVVVTPNVAGADLLDAAERALRRKARTVGDPVVIGYLSGTNTHKKDFRVAANGLLETMRAHPEVRLRIVGPLLLDESLNEVRERIEHLPLQSWGTLPDVQAAIDVNLAPLEPLNPFTDSKSAVKWMEAALVEVPTVASPRPDFRRVIRHGENGLLAETPQEWQAALEALVTDAELRDALARAAREDVLSLHTARSSGPSYVDQLRGLAPSAGGPLSINWVLGAQIEQGSDRCRNVFRIAAVLDARGHRQRLVVDPAGRLFGKSRSASAIRRSIDRTYGMPAHAELTLGHVRIPPADVSIATSAATASTVSDHRQSLFKAYFVQDIEAEPGDEDDSAVARAAYRLPLRHICLGRHLQMRLRELTGLPGEAVEVPLDPEFTLTRDPGVRRSAQAGGWERVASDFEEALRRMCFVRARGVS